MLDWDDGCVVFGVNLDGLYVDFAEWTNKGNNYSENKLNQCIFTLAVWSTQHYRLMYWVLCHLVDDMKKMLAKLEGHNRQ